MPLSPLIFPSIFPDGRDCFRMISKWKRHKVYLFFIRFAVISYTIVTLIFKVIFFYTISLGKNVKSILYEICNCTTKSIVYPYYFDSMHSMEIYNYYG
jgi:hypothetical protein